MGWGIIIDMLEGTEGENFGAWLVKFLGNIMSVARDAVAAKSGQGAGQGQEEVEEGSSSGSSSSSSSEDACTIVGRSG